MNTAAIYHRPESEYAFCTKKDTFRIRLRTSKDDVKKVYVISGDPYTITSKKWYLQRSSDEKGLSTLVHDYWEIEQTSDTRRLQYGFHIVGIDGNGVFYGDQGIFPYEPATLAESKLLFSHSLFP